MTPKSRSSGPLFEEITLMVGDDSGRPTHEQIKKPNSLICIGGPITRYSESELSQLQGLAVSVTEEYLKNSRYVPGITHIWSIEFNDSLWWWAKPTWRQPRCHESLEHVIASIKKNCNILH